MTLTVLAHDADSGLMGVALTSLLFNAGQVCPAIEPGTGCVVTQHFPRDGFGPHALARLRAGDAPATVLGAAIAEESGATIRQYAILGADGRLVAHTGVGCIAHASHVVEGSVAALGAILAGPEVVPRAFAAVRDTRAPLAERLLAGLVAGLAAGGDLRGVRSAALLVVAVTPDAPRSPEWITLHVADAASPVDELRRQYEVHRAHHRAWGAFARASSGDAEGALAEFAALARGSAAREEAATLHGAVLGAMGREADARGVLRAAMARDEQAREYLARLVEAGLIPRPAVSDAS